jgi:murein DD-endopeptidase MepM/ murein hydrolase activator NlpD
LKRAHLQRVKPVEYSPSQVEGSVERQDQAGNGVKRKKRTSAAMIGLALSMGASSLLVPRQNEGATAAEPTPTDAATLSLVPSTSAAPAATMIEHVVVKGQTLWQLAQKYQVSVEAIAAANSLKVSDVVRVGQTLRIPAAATEAQATEIRRSVEFSTARAPQQVASADLNSLPIADAQASAEADVIRVEAAQAQRNASLDRLRQQQEKLRRSLAELKTKDQAAKTEATSLGEVAKPESSAIASGHSQSASKPLQPIGYQTQSSEAASTVTLSNSGAGQSLVATSNLSNPDWLRTNQALTVPSTATSGLITQVPSPASAARNLAHQPPERPKVQQVAANPRPEMVSYQVNLGDTVAEIASAHNISPSTLVQANRISDPNFIFVGQILRVPATQAMAAAPRPRQEAPSQQVAARLSVVPTTATTLVNPAPVAQPSAGVGGNLPTPSLPTPSMSGRDPHVETLLSEIRVLRERHRTATPALAATPSTPIPVVVQVAASNLPTPSISTQFNPAGLNTVQAPEPTVRATGQPIVRVSRSQAIPIQVPAAERPQASASASQPQLVAVAPAGAESYAPLLQPVTGRLVSPDLPPLQGEDSFLPEGSPSFNGYLWPAKGLLTSGYGWRWGRMHAGIDIAADVGTPIFAAADGVVETSEWNSGGYGNMIDIRHADGSMTRYGHLNRSLVQPGQKVKQGEQIAEMGSTGYSTGPHLHFEVHPVSADGGAVDPIAYLPAKQ